MQEFALIYAESKIIISVSITPLPLGYLKIAQELISWFSFHLYIIQTRFLIVSDKQD